MTPKINTYNAHSIKDINDFVKNKGIKKEDIITINYIDFSLCTEYELIYWEAE